MSVEHVGQLERLGALRAEAQAAQRVSGLLRGAGQPSPRRRGFKRRPAQVVRAVQVEVVCRRAAGHGFREAM